METAIKISRAALHEVIVEAGEDGIDISQLCEYFGAERQVVHTYVSRLVHETPPRAIRINTGPGSKIIAACFHGSQAGRIQTAPVRCLGIVIGSVDHLVLLALRAPGGMRTDQLYARFPTSPSSAISRLRAGGLIQDGADKAIFLTDKGRELVNPDGPLARRRTLNTYCQL